VVVWNIFAYFLWGFNEQLLLFDRELKGLFLNKQRIEELIFSVFHTKYYKVFHVESLAPFIQGIFL
jgi:hypothetical protein